jgi:hypothetical protein
MMNHCHPPDQHRKPPVAHCFSPAYAQDRPNPGVDFFRFKKLSTKSINKNNLLKNNDFKKTVIL